jgi:hypothetical protein
MTFFVASGVPVGARSYLIYKFGYYPKRPFLQKVVT